MYIYGNIILWYIEIEIPIIPIPIMYGYGTVAFTPFWMPLACIISTYNVGMIRIMKE